VYSGAGGAEGFMVAGSPQPDSVNVYVYEPVNDRGSWMCAVLSPPMQEGEPHSRYRFSDALICIAPFGTESYSVIEKKHAKTGVAGGRSKTQSPMCRTGIVSGFPKLYSVHVDTEYLRRSPC
jgi:hypothetical protein